jgi:hypothetical protein
MFFFRARPRPLFWDMRYAKVDLGVSDHRIMAAALAP